MKCRFCQSSLAVEMIDLVNSPASNSYLTKESVNQPEVYYPLKVMVCSSCWLAQINESKSHSEIFDEDYAYFSSYSLSWLDHCESYVEMIAARLELNEESRVLEVASNDGYMLQYFKDKNIDCLGVEPTESTARICEQKGIETLVEFFGVSLAEKLVRQNKLKDLIIGNNVLAHVPDINDFVAGLSLVLKPNGVITLEFPHLMKLIDGKQFDTIYHEHYSYLSLYTVNKIFAKHDLCIFDVEKLTTHGGSLRVYASHISSKDHVIESRVDDLISEERQFGLMSADVYEKFSRRVKSIKNDLSLFLIECNKADKKIIAYGAAAKGNTLLNYCGIRVDMIEYVVDASPHKIGKYMPGSHLPIVSEERIRESKPDYIVILPWNLRDEIVEQLAYARDWGCKFIIAVPELTVV